MMTDMGGPGLIHLTHTYKKREQEIKNMIVMVPGMVERCSAYVLQYANYLAENKVFKSFYESFSENNVKNIYF